MLKISKIAPVAWGIWCVVLFTILYLPLSSILNTPSKGFVFCTLGVITWACGVLPWAVIQILLEENLVQNPERKIEDLKALNQEWRKLEQAYIEFNQRQKVNVELGKAIQDFKTGRRGDLILNWMHPSDN